MSDNEDCMGLDKYIPDSFRRGFCFTTHRGWVWIKAVAEKDSVILDCVAEDGKSERMEVSGPVLREEEDGSRFLVEIGVDLSRKVTWKPAVWCAEYYDPRDRHPWYWDAEYYERPWHRTQKRIPYRGFRTYDHVLADQQRSVA